MCTVQYSAIRIFIICISNFEFGSSFTKISFVFTFIPFFGAFLLFVSGKRSAGLVAKVSDLCTNYKFHLGFLLCLTFHLFMLSTSSSAIFPLSLSLHIFMLYLLMKKKINTYAKDIRMEIRRCEKLRTYFHIYSSAERIRNNRKS